MLGAAALRLPLLDRRPMHADEAILADKFGTLLATKAYPYDPREYHGPILAYVTWPAAQLAGQTTYNTLTEITLRIVPAIAGILLALSPLLLAPAIGANAAVAAAALVAVSPAMVYYSRYFIPEMPLALWTALLLVAVVRQSWMLAGAAAALMIATKETAILALAAAAAAYVAAYRPKHVNLRALAAFSVALIAGVSLLLAPPWKWPVLAQAAAAYFERGTGGGGHAHPWYTYLRWLVVTEAPILIAAVIGFVAAWRATQPAVRFLALYTVLLLAIYSAIPYKTPWCAVSALYGLALLGRSWRCAASLAFCLRSPSSVLRSSPCLPASAMQPTRETPGCTRTPALACSPSAIASRSSRARRPTRQSTSTAVTTSGRCPGISGSIPSFGGGAKWPSPARPRRSCWSRPR